jgi:hypothetical protein
MTLLPPSLPLARNESARSREAKAFRGRWWIVEMEVWPDDYLDLIEPAHITFEGGTDGVFAFGAVKGWLDVRYSTRDGAACAEFSWVGPQRRRPGLWPRLGHPRHGKPPRRPSLHPQQQRLALRRRA